MVLADRHILVPDMLSTLHIGCGQPITCSMICWVTEKCVQDGCQKTWLWFTRECKNGNQPWSLDAVCARGKWVSVKNLHRRWDMRAPRYRWKQGRLNDLEVSHFTSEEKLKSVTFRRKGYGQSVLGRERCGSPWFIPSRNHQCDDNLTKLRSIIWRNRPRLLSGLCSWTTTRNHTQ